MSKAGEARKTKEEKDLEEFKRQKQQELLERTEKVMTETFSTTAGKRALRMIMERCCYQKPITFVDNETRVNTDNMIHNAAMQGFYLWLRKQIDRDTLIAVENQGLEEDEEN